MSAGPSRARVLGVAAVAAAAVLTVAALSPQGLGQYRRLSNEVDRMRRQNAELQQGNSRLRSDITALSRSPAFQEKAVREDLGYVRPGEKLFIVDVGTGAAPPVDAATPPQTSSR